MTTPASHSDINVNMQDMDSESSGTPSSTVSILTQIPDVIFTHVCTFLDLPCKCLNLHVLCRAISSLFRPESCCKGFVDASFKTTPQTAHAQPPHVQYVARRTAWLAPYLKFATNVKSSMCNLSPIDTPVVHQLVRAFESCLSNRVLEQIEIEEPIFPDSLLISPLLSHLITLQPNQLQSLHTIKLSWTPDPIENPQALEDPSINWSGLSNCQSLKILSLLGLQYLSDAEGLDLLPAIYTALPNSIERFTCDLFRRPMTVQDLNRKLLSPTFLPNLRNVGMNETYEVRSDHLVQGLSTIMAVSGKPRPTQTVALSPMYGLMPLDWCWSVRELSLIPLGPGGIAQLVALPDTTLPCLQNLQFGVNAPVDISPVMSFASKRPLTYLAIMYNDGEEGRCTPLSDDGLRHLASMSKLERMLVTSGGSQSEAINLFGNNLTNELPQGCWPDMRTLIMSGCFTSPEQAICFIKASPKLVMFQTHSNPFALTLLLPALAHYCPEITGVMDRNTSPTEPDFDPEIDVHLPEIQAAFETYPITTQTFRHLGVLHLKMEFIYDDALHFLCSQLMSLPVLWRLATHQNVDIIARAIEGVDANVEEDQKEYSDEIWDAAADIFVLRTYFISRIPSLRITNSPLDEVTLPDECMNVGPIFTEVAPLERQFRTEYSFPPANGRQLFCATLHSVLTEHAKSVCHFWDQGDYGAWLYPYNDQESQQDDCDDE